jgi:hypothetical protein
VFAYWLLFFVFAVGAVQSRSQIASDGRRVMSDRTGGAPTATVASTPILSAAAIFAALMIGFRYEVGADWPQYLEIFHNLSYTDFLGSLTSRGSDPGYGLLNWLANAMDLGIWAVNLPCAAIFTFGLIRFARCQPNPWLAVLVAVPYLVIGVAMGYTRQGVAIGLVMCGLAAVHRGSLPKFVIWVFAAALFHKTALVVLPIVAFSFTRNRFQTFLLGIFVALFGYYVLLRPALDQLTVGYIDQVYESQGAGIRLAMNLAPAFIFLTFSKRFGLSETERTIWRNMAIAALLAFAAYYAVASSVVVDRLALYLIPLQLLAFSRLPNVFGVRGASSIPVVMLVVLYSGAVQFTWLVYANHARYWLPYKVYPLFW